MREVNFAVISDTHGKTDELIEALKKENLQGFLHLGDFERDAQTISDALNLLYYSVPGNCDPGTTPFKLIRIEGKRIFITHGHRFFVDYGLEKLYQRARESEAEIAFFGHTHKQELREYKGIILANPGSAAFPRGGDTKGYFLLRFRPSLTIVRRTI